MSGQKDLNTGNFLGDLTDELEKYGTGSYISSFVSGGPKCYAYRVQLPNGQTKEVCKFKGVHQNYATKDLIDFDTLRQLVVEGGDPFTLEYSSRKENYTSNKSQETYC